MISIGRLRGVEFGITELGFIVVVIMLLSCSSIAESRCSQGCDAVASYYVWEGTNLTLVDEIFTTDLGATFIQSLKEIQNRDDIPFSVRLSIPFSCDCIDKEFLGHIFQYRVRSGDTYSQVATSIYSNLTTTDWLQNNNNYGAVDQNAYLNVTVNCSCGDPSVSKDYGYFLTYPLRPDDSLSSLSTKFSLPSQLIQQYNPATNFNSGSGLLYVPIKGISMGAIAGISVAGIVAALFMAVCIYVGIFRKKKMKALLLQQMSDNSNQHWRGGGIPLNITVNSADGQVGASPRLTGITVDKSMVFSYEELAQATDDFSLANKIGEGGFGAVYYAELRGEKAAIKKMDLQASKEFLAELKILTNVHHLNLVRLIGYCVEGSLFIVYEFIENGNLSEHLRGSGKEPLQWPRRVQIALDSARGLEYIHEHTVPVYIHRDIKSANILIDKKFHGKVADFGLVKLTEVGSSVQTQLAGTFGYMPPESAYGKVSPKVDVFAFGVILYELISAKEAIVKENESSAESKGLVALFDEALSHLDTREEFHKLVDPTLGHNYPFDSIHKMALLAKACTHKDAKLRPSMRSVVVALMSISSSTEDWDVGSFHENQALTKLMSGRYLCTRLYRR